MAHSNGVNSSTKVVHKFAHTVQVYGHGARLGLHLFVVSACIEQDWSCAIVFIERLCSW